MGVGFWVSTVPKVFCEKRLGLWTLQFVVLLQGLRKSAILVQVKRMLMPEQSNSKESEKSKYSEFLTPAPAGVIGTKANAVTNG